MDISLDDLKMILTEGRLFVGLKGATCIHCNLVLPTVQDAAAHDSICEKHPLQAELAQLRAALKASAELEQHLRECHSEALELAHAHLKSLTASELETERIRAALEAAKADGERLKTAMREVCAIVGGQTADGVSVDFLLNVPDEVRAALAEARKDGARLEEIAKIGYATDALLCVPISDKAFEILPYGEWTVDDIREAIDAKKEG